MSYSSSEEAVEAVRRGHAWGVIDIPSNFSSSISDRIGSGRFASDEIINGSEIDITLDMSSVYFNLFLHIYF